MKIKKFFLILVFITTPGLMIAQESNISVRILDTNSKEPIFGAVIQYKGKAIAFTGDDGVFELNLKENSAIDSIVVSHISYRSKKLSFKEIQQNGNIIYLNDKMYNLGQVSVSSTKKTNIIKQVIKRFNETYPALSDIAEVNYKQLISYKGQPKGYFECFGNMLLIGRKEKNPFFDGFIIPYQVRRTKEDPIISKLFLDQNHRVQLGGSFLFNIMLEYRFYEVFQPLNKKNSNAFIFHLDSVSNDNNIPCYVFSFRQKKSLYTRGWSLYGMNGQLIVEQKSFNLRKTILAFNRNDLCSDQIELEYTVIGNKIFPKKARINSIRNKFLQNREPQKIYLESEILFNKIYEKQKKFRLEYEIECFLPEFNYDKEFWKRHEIKGYFKSKLNELIGNKWDQAFEAGSKEQIFEDNGKLVNSLFRKYGLLAIEKINKEIELNKSN